MDSSVELIPQVTSVRAARQVVRARLGEEAPSVELGELAELLTSELATNAVVHAGTAFTVTVKVRRGALRVTVRDGSATLPRLKEAGPYEVAGRGLALVATLSSRWGMAPVPGGKAVWFELDL